MILYTSSCPNTACYDGFWEEWKRFGSKAVDIWDSFALLYCFRIVLAQSVPEKNRTTLSLQMDSSDRNLITVKYIHRSLVLAARKDTVRYNHTCIGEQASFYQVRLPVRSTGFGWCFVIIALVMRNIARVYPPRETEVPVL